MEVTCSTPVRITDSSCVSAARRVSMDFGTRLGWSDEDRGRAALIATEMGTNLLKHARDGVVVYNVVKRNRVNVLQIIAIDRGPGMADIAGSMSDGYSTAGSPGTGLGAIQRTAGGLDVYSTPGKGTVMIAELAERAAQDWRGSVERIGGICTPYLGQTASGDAWDAESNGDRMVVAVIDGLGHGSAAADAADAAVKAFRAAPLNAPAVTLARFHDALRSTRGAAAAIALIDRLAGTVQYAGIGNITGVIVSPSGARHLVSHNGTLGHIASRITEFTYPWTDASRLVMHSDGISARWQPDEWTGLWQRSPTMIASTIYRDYVRSRDDATVVVVGGV